MPKNKSRGRCLLCNSVLGKSGMTKHLQSCMKNNLHGKRQSSGRQVREGSSFHIIVEGYGLPGYWMHLLVSAATKLEKLDHFLRDIWLECCGHLSVFKIEGIRYSSWPMTDYGEKGMSKKIGDLLSPGLKFLHDYDMGTTTEIVLKVISEQEMQVDSVEILARNEAPFIKCDNCDDVSVYVCSGCIYAGEGWLCGKCVQDHECGEEMLLPVVNSPRVGMCGYTGNN